MRTGLTVFQGLRRALRPWRRMGREWRHRVFRRLGRLRGDWRHGLPEELEFWENALRLMFPH